ncbi:MAG: hypothetical protein AAB691_04210 [Patescibacteria group bacterium]
MRHIESYQPDTNREVEENEIEEALHNAGLNLKAPRPETEAYKRLYAAAEEYMRSVLNHGKASIPPQFRPDGENYFRPKPKMINPAEDIRREHHNTLAKLLFGKPVNELPRAERDKISNFSAYLTGHVDYVDQW